jgi:hypothetical protein
MAHILKAILINISWDAIIISPSDLQYVIPVDWNFSILYCILNTNILYYLLCYCINIFFTLIKSKQVNLYLDSNINYHNYNKKITHRKI